MKNDRVLAYIIKSSYHFPTDEDGNVIIEKGGRGQLANEEDIQFLHSLGEKASEKKMNCVNCIFIVNSQEYYLREICWRGNNNPKLEGFFKGNCHVCKGGGEFTYTKTEKELPEKTPTTLDGVK